MHKPRAILGATFITGGRSFPEGALTLRDGQIEYFGTQKGAPSLAGYEVTDARGLVCTPGLIDLHINGFMGADAASGKASDLAGMARGLAQVGVTSFLPTIISNALNDMATAAACIATFASDVGAAESLGIYYEGPFLSPQFAGAHERRHLLPPTTTSWNVLSKAAGSAARIVTIAPELTGAPGLIETISASGVTCALGHSGASPKEVVEGFRAGIRHATHLCNAMPTFHHRTPGLVGAVLSNPEISFELIADGVHLHPETVALFTRAAGAHRVALISDALSPAGLSETSSTGAWPVIGLGPVHREGDQLVTQHGTLAGGAASGLDLLRSAVAESHVSLPNAIDMLTRTPAQIAGAGKRKGLLAMGYDADVLLLNRDLTLAHAIVRGHEERP